MTSLDSNGQYTTDKSRISTMQCEVGIVKRCRQIAHSVDAIRTKYANERSLFILTKKTKQNMTDIQYLKARTS